MSISTVLEYYSRKDVQEAMLEVAKNREVVSVFKDGSFGKRPNVLVYPNDILQEVKTGARSFHCSVERWKNPMELTPGMNKEEMDSIRLGFDLILDPDVPDFEIGKLVTKKLVEALEEHGVKNYSIKYTGGKGFHIGVPFESFPARVNFKDTRLLYPELPRTIIEYLKWYVKDELREELLDLDTPINLAKRVGKEISQVISEDGIDPFKLVELDSMVLSPRHLFRMPYSLHEKTLLVSLPIEKSELEDFEKKDARPENVEVSSKFLEAKSKKRDATSLVVEALDWAQTNPVKEEPIAKPEVKKTVKVKEVPEELFPPCIKTILNGLSDGRKRAIFVLITFLRNMGWSWDKIEKRLMEWNEKNKPPLRMNYIKTQLRWHMRQERNLLPPNCDNPGFYKEPTMNVCKPDSVCLSGVKNPITYPFKKMAYKAKRKK